MVRIELLPCFKSELAQILNTAEGLVPVGGEGSGAIPGDPAFEEFLVQKVELFFVAAHEVDSKCTMKMEVNYAQRIFWAWGFRLDGGFRAWHPFRVA